MTALLTVTVVTAGAVTCWHMWLAFKSGGYLRSSNWSACGCGHASSWHADHSKSASTGGCRSKDVPIYSSDPYGYCPCPRTMSQIETRAEVKSALDGAA